MASAARFFVDLDLAVGASLPLPAPVAHHALRVLRLRVGAPLVLFNGRGGEFHARLTDAQATPRAAVEGFAAVERESPLQLTLAQALVAADKLDWVVEKATELGATGVLLFSASRSVVRLDGARLERRAQHLREVAISACCQCGRNRIPRIAALPSLAAVLEHCGRAAAKRMLVPGAAAALGQEVAAQGIGGAAGMAVLVGPEGGWDAEELDIAVAAGYTAVRLGPRVLRTETAGVAALAVLQALAGDFAPLAAATG